MPASTGTWAVFAGGGTGGHLYPGLAVARELVSRGHDPTTLHFVGARRGLEATTRALEGFPATLLPGRGLRRDLSAASLAANSRALAGEAAAVAMAMRLFAKWRPSVVVTLGGYAGLPCVVASAAWGVPLVVVNVDAVPGAVNRLASRVAAACAVGVPGVPLRKAMFTGVPVRAEMAAVDRGDEARRQARRRLGLPLEAMVVAVSGGSLGALRLNRATAELAELWSARSDVAIRHVVGRRDWDEFEARASSAAALGAPAGLVYQRVRYEEDMAGLYAAADVAVQRAGANTVAELALAAVPSVLVPLPGAPGDHQGANARTLAAAGGAVVVPDAELDGHRLARELEVLIAEPGLLARMGRAARAIARPDATAAVADLVEEHARRATRKVGARAD
ncbi:MAG TPA: UDP-N-acetylglucosamine--N-acetylmuramyl-(pentapeptide) pyrophosphoryl-undecaprenol N-acetylglucosamine transferase [Acidimicrobiales bacterium]|nr:UDP-N-acetylglucosamine--N-acetylmuramyl-(pentapeptide) pyrophosphoryl-undecaprenol N-acetylglucosamine transferase [Acidimicrobiales bacterium]